MELLSIQVPDMDFDSEDPRGQSIWNFYRKDLQEDGANNIDDNSMKHLPNIPNTNQNLKIINDIGDIAQEFKMTIQKAIKQRCCCFCCYTKLFGTLEQNEMLLKKNFDGKSFLIKGYSGAVIDCMFFPATTEENLNISTENPTGQYLSQPTYIMCSPNALLYQQMVTSPNAYWLSFFIKRGINVVCWNYRGYGKSRPGACCTFCCSGALNPYYCKLDAEKVFDFVVNKLKITGKIGVYGRSIGGIASTHLAAKFPHIVSSLIVDRTFCEMDLLAARRLTGLCTRFLFKFISNHWKAINDQNFIDAKCFKVLTCDPLDDVVDNFSSLAAGVASKLSVHAYESPKWRKFFDCLCLVYDIEDHFYSKMSEKDRLNFECKLASAQTFSDTLARSVIVHPSHYMGETQISIDEEAKLISKVKTEFSVAYLRQRCLRMKSFEELHTVIYSLMSLLNDF